ncbi:MAG: 2-hydroxyacyl-CoA dehydratase family protein [candidate division WOR-3 bacterium]|nr:2-hydroxyacyl-CoA dehydratase family protein [candidate division WOR-3 bacterium]
MSQTSQTGRTSPTSGWADPKPARVSFDEWQELFERVPDDLIERYHYFGRNEAWAKYLFPPQTFAIYGMRHLRRLKYDNSLAALRMWGFVQNETERLFRARQIGRRVIATMGDLGAVPVIVNSFADCVAFYPDCIWWTPFAMESRVLLDAAAELGIGDATCFSRAALGAFAKHSYFPDPDLVIASTGASCDDYSGVEQLAERFAREMLWVEMPVRCRMGPMRHMLVKEYERVVEKMEQVTGHRLTEDELRAGIQRTNTVRKMVSRLRELAYGSGVLPALEMMVVEFGNLHYYSDITEWTAVLEHLLATAEERAAKGERVLNEDALRIVWVTPPADPLLLTYVEDHGARVVGTEYVINQALELIDESKPGLEAIAESFTAASLIGSTKARAASVIRQAREGRAEGVIISSIFGGSHCAMEGRLIADYVKAELDLPVLEFDVAPPSNEISRQLQTRIDAFLEVLRNRR